MIQTLISVLDTLGEAALLTNAELTLVAMNPLAETLYQVSPRSMVGQNLVALIGTIVSSTREEGWAAILRGDTWRGVTWHQRPNRSRFRAEISVRAIFDHENTFVGTMAIVKDVTAGEAELVRQSILGRCLRAMSDAKTVGELYQRILEALTGEDAANSAIFRTREVDGYHLLAVHGISEHLLEPIKIANFVDEEPEFLRGETVEVVFAAPRTHEKYQLVRSLGFRQAHLVGQRVAGELVGSLALLYRQIPWVDLRPILPEIAAALGARLERERSQARLERERTALAALAQVTTALRQAEQVQDAYRIATEFALQATRASSSFVLIASPNRQQMQPLGGCGAHATEIMQYTLGREQGLSWQVLDTGQPRVATVLSDDREAFRYNSTAQGTYIGVPIFQTSQLHKTVIGVLTADNHTNGQAFSPTDLDVLTAISEALSGTLSRLDALETARNRAIAFAKLAQLSSDLEQLETQTAIAERGLDTLLQLTGLDVAGYMTLHGQHLKVVSYLGASRADYLEFRERTPISPDDVFGQVAQSQQTLLIADYQQTAFFSAATVSEYGFRTAVICPVILDGQVKAFIAAASIEQPRPFAANLQELVELIAGRLARAIERSDGVQEVLNTRAETFRTLGLALEARDFETKGHTDRVLTLAMQLGQKVGLSPSQMQALEWGALLHDIGKIAVPDMVLLKPGKLDPDEWLLIRQHPGTGFEMLQGLTFLPKETLEIVLYHQERIDGTGYPECLKAAQIPYLARLFAVVDVFDALTSPRSYKPAWDLAKAIAELEQQAGKTLDATLVKTFIGVVAPDEVAHVA